MPCKAAVPLAGQPTCTQGQRFRTHGRRYDQVFYRTISAGKCFEVIFLIHSSNIGNYPSGTVVEYDRVRLLHKLEEVLDTFNVK